MPQLELVRFTVGTSADVGSALRIWTRIVEDREPNTVATDEDGDTSARGMVASGWLDIVREPRGVTFTLTPDEKFRRMQPITFFEDETAAVEELSRLVVAFCRGIVVTRVQFETGAADLCDSVAETMAMLRDYLPAVRFPDEAQDGNYKISVREPMTAVTGLEKVTHANWRNGRRVYTEHDDEDADRIFVQATGTAITVESGKLGSIDGDAVLDAVIDELVATAMKVMREGLDAF